MYIGLECTSDRLASETLAEAGDEETCTTSIGIAVLLVVHSDGDHAFVHTREGPSHGAVACGCVAVVGTFSEEFLLVIHRGDCKGAGERQEEEEGEDKTAGNHGAEGRGQSGED